MYREIEKDLTRWKESSGKALLVTGARQVGKTYSIRQFAKENYSSFIEINFLENEEIRKLFAQAANSKDILLYISAITEQSLIKGNTLIFLDEVQECPEIVTAIKFLVEEGSYSYILSGSLLGIELKSVRSLPVGYMEILQMYPMNFQEFCIANHVTEGAMDYLKECFCQVKPVMEAFHARFLNLFHLYLVVGGMPAAVKRYLDTNNLQEVIAEQKAISVLYKEDISKYDERNKLYIKDIYDLIPSELNAQNKRFEANTIKNGIKFSRVENGFLWLTDAGVALPVYCANDPKFPLILSKARNQLKLFLCDVGLLASMYMNQLQIKILNKELDINYGGVYENVVAQELVSHGITPFYYKNNRMGELDFLIELDGKVVPIEVKSGKSYKTHSALDHLMKTDEYAIEKAYVLSNYNVSAEGKVVYLPIYMSMFFQNQPVPEMIYRVDLTGLV